MNYYKNFLAVKENLSKSISTTNAALRNAPEGYLNVYKVKKNYYWKYTSKVTKKRTYISHSDKAKAEKLALKTYNRYKLKYETMVYKAIGEFEKIYDINMLTPEEYLDKNPGLAELVLPLIINVNESWKYWENEDYFSDAGYEEALIYKTIKGHLVRSKSEVIISDALYRKGIPYRYEESDWYYGVKLTPDFKAVNVRTGKIVIWEHAGIMDDPEYVKKLVDKITRYTMEGLRFGIDFIITTETKERPLDSAYVEEIIDKYFV